MNKKIFEDYLFKIVDEGMYVVYGRLNGYVLENKWVDEFFPLNEFGSSLAAKDFVNELLRKPVSESKKYAINYCLNKAKKDKKLEEEKLYKRLYKEYISRK